MSTSNDMVAIRDVSRAFGDTLAVRNASLTLKRGDFLTIVGPSGCGKTTLLRMIAGFDAPSAGEILINGQDMASVPAYRRSIGMVFQKLALFPHMSAAQNVAFPLRMRRFEPARIPELVDRYLNLVQLGHLAKRRPHQLSGGQQQRVAIARALSFGPDLLLLDEPLSALDRKLREEMQLEFRRIQQELGVTTINVTHDQREALVMSDQMIVMNDGVIQQSNTPEAIYQQPATRFVASFLGVTAMFRGTVLAGTPGALQVEIGGVTMQARGSADVFTAGDTVDCAVRAEQVSLLVPGAPEPENTVSGTVRQRIFEGDRNVYEVVIDDTDDALVHVFDRDGAVRGGHDVGAPVRLGWSASAFYAFPAAD